jgi:hypothetical protein
MLPTTHSCCPSYKAKAEGRAEGSRLETCYLVRVFSEQPQRLSLRASKAGPARGGRGVEREEQFGQSRAYGLPGASAPATLQENLGEKRRPDSGRAVVKSKEEK